MILSDTLIPLSINLSMFKVSFHLYLTVLINSATASNCFNTLNHLCFVLKPFTFKFVSANLKRKY